MIDLYFWPTPNGHKVAIALEEMALPYQLVPVNIGRGDQLAPDFLAISPNNRMPAIVDREPIGGGAPLSVFESGAILLYLAEKSGQYWPQEPHQKYAVVQWVMWQMANQGPKFGENGHFRRAEASGKYADLSYPRQRFDDEVNRLYGVMNQRLYDSAYLGGDQYSIADMIAYPWAASWEYQGQSLDEFKYVKRWLDELAARPAVQRGMALGRDLSEDVSKLSSEEQERRSKVLSHQRARPVIEKP